MTRFGGRGHDTASRPRDRSVLARPKRSRRTRRCAGAPSGCGETAILREGRPRVGRMASVAVRTRQPARHSRTRSAGRQPHAPTRNRIRAAASAKEKLRTDSPLRFDNRTCSPLQSVGDIRTEAAPSSPPDASGPHCPGSARAASSCSVRRLLSPFSVPAAHCAHRRPRRTRTARRSDGWHGTEWPAPSAASCGCAATASWRPRRHVRPPVLPLR